MKSAPNGGINLSVLDGWWREGFNGSQRMGYRRGSMTQHLNFKTKWTRAAFYQLLENQNVPLYYAKPDGKLPLAWLQLMRESIRSVTPVFKHAAHGEEYAEQLYIRAAQGARKTSPKMAAAPRRTSANGKRRCGKDWTQVQVSDVQVVNKRSAKHFQLANRCRSPHACI